jgi:hypothetical protein
MKKVNLIKLNINVEPNEECIPNSNITYELYWDEKNSTFICIKDKNDCGWVDYDDAPKTLKYKLLKPFDAFTDDEKESILEYSGLSLKTDGFQLHDIWMERSFTKLISTK